MSRLGSLFPIRRPGASTVPPVRCAVPTATLCRITAVLLVTSCCNVAEASCGDWLLSHRGGFDARIVAVGLLEEVARPLRPAVPQPFEPLRCTGPECGRAPMGFPAAPHRPVRLDSDWPAACLAMSAAHPRIDDHSRLELSVALLLSEGLRMDVFRPPRADRPAAAPRIG